MLSALKPVSDLQRVQHFDDYDLNANRSGVLSPRQRRRFVRARSAGHALGTLTACFGLAIMTSGFISAAQLSVVGLVLAFVLVLALISLTISLRPAFGKNVMVVKGLLRKDFAIPQDSVSFDQIAIGPERFYISYELNDVLDEEAVYQAYYLKRNQRVGGNLLLTVEMIEPAPPDDE